MLKFVKGVALAALVTSASAQAQVMLGAYVPGDGFQRSEIMRYNSAMQKPLAFVNIFSSFSHDWDHLYWQSSNIVREGAMPMISWMPVDLNRPDENILSEIALGLHDSYLDEWAQKLEAWVAQYPVEEQPTILLRFGHEFNGNWYSYGNSPFFYQSAWQYIHDRFEAAGVNKHIEWVWSANNVNVDDYNDLTVYYPGSEYVDWTSIDGYNFGSNYSWTTWESFTDLYADSYLTLVNYFPEKPILIAEIGTAEERDLPSWFWGQFGDDSDAGESKEAWVADFLTQLETHFPAVRAVAWFNTNKELGWSLTGNGNSGYNAFATAIQSDYFTSEFLSAPVCDAIAAPTETDLALAAAQAKYEAVQQQVESTAADLFHAQQRLADAETGHQQVVVQRADTLSAMKIHRQEYYDIRDKYEVAVNGFSNHRGQYLGHRDKATNERGRKLSADQEVRTAVAARAEQRQVYLDARQSFHVAREAYRTAHALYVSAREKRDTAAEGSEFDAALVLFDEAKAVRTLKVEQLQVTRTEMLNSLYSYRQSVSDVTSLLEKRGSIVTDYRQTVEALNTTRQQYRSSLQYRNAKRFEFVETRMVYLQQYAAFREANIAYVESRQTVEQISAEVEAATVALQQLEQERSQAYNELTNATFLVSMQTQSQGLMLADGSNGKQPKVSDKETNKTDESSKGNSGYANAGKKSEDFFIDKKLARKVKISKDAQRELALSRKPDPVDPEKALKRQNKYKNMTAEEKEALKLQKINVLLY